MTQEVIDTFTREEVKYMLYPYYIGVSGINGNIFNMFNAPNWIRVEIHPVIYGPDPRIDLYLISPYYENKPVLIGSVGSAIRAEVINRYYGVLSNRRSSKIDLVITEEDHLVDQQ